MYETIIYEVTGRVARITLNRPEARNSLSDQMTGELLDALETAKDDDGVRVIVLTGAGDRAFCAGADLGSLGQAQRSGGPIVGVTASLSSPSSPADGEPQMLADGEPGKQGATLGHQREAPAGEEVGRHAADRLA